MTCLVDVNLFSNRTHEMCRLVWALVSNYDGHVLRFLEPSKEAFTRAFQFGSTFFLGRAAVMITYILLNTTEQLIVRNVPFECVATKDLALGVFVALVIDL